MVKAKKGKFHLKINFSSPVFLTSQPLEVKIIRVDYPSKFLTVCACMCV